MLEGGGGNRTLEGYRSVVPFDMTIVPLFRQVHSPVNSAAVHGLVFVNTIRFQADGSKIFLSVCPVAVKWCVAHI
jgi:hypothetical protein